MKRYTKKFQESGSELSEVLSDVKKHLKNLPFEEQESLLEVINNWFRDEPIRYNLLYNGDKEDWRGNTFADESYISKSYINKHS